MLARAAQRDINGRRGQSASIAILTVVREWVREQVLLVPAGPWVVDQSEQAPPCHQRRVLQWIVASPSAAVGLES